MMRRTILDQFLRDNRPPWKRWAMVVVGLLLLLLAPVIAHSQGGGADTVQIVWTAPGDDGDVGTATTYEVRISTAPITTGNWGTANVVGPPPAPLSSGTRQALTVRGLSSDTTYYFAIRTSDEVGNPSALSNVLTWDWSADVTPPSAPTGVAVGKFGSSVLVTWSAAAEPDLDGYSVYRALSPGGPRAKLNSTLITPAQFTDTAVPGGEPSVWYTVTASDLFGNESSQSSTVGVPLDEPPAPWTMAPVYPNPSATSEPVCIPIGIPVGGAGDAAVDIVNGGGRRVRHLAIATATTCAGGNGVVWDGTNDAGRPVAPGVYRVRLSDGSAGSAKLVRVP